MYYLFSTFLCQDRLTFLGHNLSNPETMCHNVSVSKQPGTKSSKYREYLYFNVTQFPLSSKLIVSDPSSIVAHDLGSGLRADKTPL